MRDSSPHTNRIIGTATVETLDERRLLAFVADASLGTDGIFRYDVPGALATITHAISSASNDKILIGGAEILADSHPFIARLNAVGTPDSGFSADGHLMLPDSIGGSVSQIIQLASGKYLAIGNLGVARVTSGGSLDSSYSGDGVATFEGSFAAVDSTGAFYTHEDGIITKYTAGGSIDTSWGTNGFFALNRDATAPLFEFGTFSVIVRTMTDGRIVVGVDGTDESGSGEAGIIRISSNGTLNTSFNGTGVAFIPTIGAQSLKDLIVLPDTQTLVLFNGEGSINGLYALSGSGSPKSVFGETPSTGHLTPMFFRSSEAFADEATSLAMLADGSPIILGGFADFESSPTYAAVMKLNGNFTADGAFAIDGDAIATLDPRVDTNGIHGFAKAGAVNTDGSINLLIGTSAGNALMRLFEDETGEFDVSRFGNTIAINGTDTADRIVVSLAKNRAVVQINGDRASFTNRDGQFISVNGNAGDDQILLDDSLTARSIFIEGGYGNDVIDIFDQPFAGASRRVFGGAGNDTVRVANAPTVVFGDAGRDGLFGSPFADAIFGGDDNDLVVGGAGNDYLEGNGGRDTIDGSAGNDRLIGHGGNDLLLGGKGNDTLNGFGGLDLLNGGPGADYIDAGPDNDTIQSRDTIADQVFGGSGTDTVTADNADAIDGVETVDVVI